MIIELEVNGARLIISGDNLNVNVSEDDGRAQHSLKDINAYRPRVGPIHHLHPLKVWRKSNGLTQAVFAEMIGIGTWMVNAIETGRRVPSFDLVQKIISATAGSIQPNDLFKKQVAA